MKVQSKLISIGSKWCGIFGLGPWGYNKLKSCALQSIVAHLSWHLYILELFYHSCVLNLYRVGMPIRVSLNITPKYHI